MQTYRKDFPAPDIYGQFGKITDRKEIPVPELAEGGPAYAEFHLWHLISMESPLSRRMTGIDS